MLENCLVINLPERKDRLEQFKKEAQYISLNYQIVSGVKDAVPYKGIGQAHINAILIAKQNEWDNVLIMEDDVVFQGKEKTARHLNECLNNAPNEWDVLLGGVYYSERLAKYNHYWNSIGVFCGLHFYIVNYKAYDNILKYNFNEHIDRWMGLNVKCFVTRKFMATQSAGFSDNVKKNVDYKNKIKKFELL